MLIVTVVVIVGTFIATLLSDSRPVLGLDLQGGISIVLFPVKGSDLARSTPRSTIIRNRVDGLGIAEPDVQPPGQHDRRRPARREGPRRRPRASSARPPSCGSARCIGSRSRASATPTPARPPRPAKGATTTTDGRGRPPRRRHAATTTTVARHAVGRAAHDRHRADRGSRPARRRSRPRRSRRAAPTATTGATGATATTARPAADDHDDHARRRQFPGARTLHQAEPARHRRRAAGDPARPQAGPSCYVLGPTIVTGQERRLGRTSIVRLEPRRSGSPTCTSRTTTSSTRSRGRYVEQAGRDRARRRRAVGADDQPGHHRPRRRRSPATFTAGRGEASSRSCCGTARCPCSSTRRSRPSRACRRRSARTSCTAGIVAGLIGLALVALYMLALLPAARPRRVGRPRAHRDDCSSRSCRTCRRTQGLTLTLAGVTGIIVSVGVTVDSYVVYFERLKDEVRTGQDGAVVARHRASAARSARSSPPTSCRCSARSCSTCSPPARCAASRSSSASRR